MVDYKEKMKETLNMAGCFAGAGGMETYIGLWPVCLSIMMLEF